MLKKVLTLFLCFVLLPIRHVSGTDERTPDDLFLLALGDSITTGYELEGGLYGNDGYVNLAARELGLTRDQYENRAVNGYTTADMLKLLPLCTEDIRRADIIVFDIGYNDILGQVYTRICTQIAGEICDIPKLQAAYAELTAEQHQAVLDSLGKVNYASLYKRFETELRAILEYMRAENKDAHIYMQSLYDPFGGMGVMEAFSDSVVREMNRVIRRTAEEFGCGFLDVYTAFYGRGTEYTYIGEYDIHPNEAGHRAVFELFADALRHDGYLPSAESAPETGAGDLPANTAGHTPALILTLILSAAILLCGGFMILRRKRL